MPPPAAPLQALVVEDDSQTRFAVGAILVRLGYEVLSAGSMAEALVAMERQHPHVVVIEVALVGIDGLAALSALRDASPDCAIMVLSQLDGLRQAALRAGASDVVAPTELRRLAACVQRLGPAVSAECECCRRPVADCSSSPALGDGSLRVGAAPNVVLRVDHPGTLSPGARSGGGHPSSSTAPPNRPGG